VLPMSDCMPPCCSVARRQTTRCWLGCHQWFWMDQLTHCLRTEVSSAYGPFITDLHQDGVFQADHGCIIGEGVSGKLFENKKAAESSKKSRDETVAKRLCR
jgi:hypothetical protein